MSETSHTYRACQERLHLLLDACGTFTHTYPCTVKSDPLQHLDFDALAMTACMLGNWREPSDAKLPCRTLLRMRHDCCCVRVPTSMQLLCYVA